MVDTAWLAASHMGCMEATSFGLGVSGRREMCNPAETMLDPMFQKNLIIIWSEAVFYQVKDNRPHVAVMLGGVVYSAMCKRKDGTFRQQGRCNRYPRCVRLLHDVCWCLPECLRV